MAFRVGDRVRVNHNNPFFEGKEGVVTRVQGSGDNQIVTVRLDPPWGEQNFSSLELDPAPGDEMDGSGMDSDQGNGEQDEEGEESIDTAVQPKRSRKAKGKAANQPKGKGSTGRRGKRA